VRRGLLSARKDDAPIAALEARLGYQFGARALIEEALTHASALTRRGDPPASYERLEFMGDRVLGVITAERLFRQFPQSGEDELALRFNALVNRGACARAARRAGLGEAVRMSDSERSSGGADKEAILADCCEAVIAALYLDGGLGAARDFVERFWADEFDDAAALRKDAKTVLQEWAAARKKSLAYRLTDRSGPDHAPRFVVEAELAGAAPARGEGGSKREAEQAAAAALLKAEGVDV
jgi:ribonuclease III